MTLVRDYAKLIETDMASGAFDTVFSLTPKPPEEAQALLEELTEMVDTLLVHYIQNSKNSALN